MSILTGEKQAPYEVIGETVSSQTWHIYNNDISEYNFLNNPILARLLALKEIPPQEATKFIEAKIKDHWVDPFHLLDMKESVDLFIETVKKNEKIAIFGDYDVDGATSSASIKIFLENLYNVLKLDTKVEIYIPDRVKEGYGPNNNAIEYLANLGVKLIIFTDCGTTAIDQINFANSLSVKTIIIDHHASGNTLPKTFIINPNRDDEDSPYKHLAAVGVTFLFIIAVIKNLKLEKDFSQYIKSTPLSIIDPDSQIVKFNPLSLIDLVALGTVCDVVPLKTINRAFVKQGLQTIAKKKNIGIKLLIEISRINNRDIITSSDVGFTLGPRINSAGRLNKSELGSQLLSTKTYEEAEKIVLTLEQLNLDRKNKEQDITAEATKQISENPDPTNIVYAYSKNWHSGIIGITASRMKDKFLKPSMIMALEGNILKASIRSTITFNAGDAINKMKENQIITEGGGHKMAGGFTAPFEQLQKIVEFMNQEFIKQKSNTQAINIDIVDTISINAINNQSMIEAIKSLEPFGSDNPPPIFQTLECNIVDYKIKNGHIICYIRDSYHPQSSKIAMLFNGVNTDLGTFLCTKPYNIKLALQLSLSEYKRKITTQTIIKDARK